MIVWPEELQSEHESNKTILKDKYVKFNEEVAAQEVRVNEVFTLAEMLLEKGHPEENVIRRRREVNIDVILCKTHQL